MFPTRLIDLGPNTGHLNDNTILRPRLVIRDVDFDQSWTLSSYMTLSHCWGRCDTLKLTKDNIERLKGGVPFADLPKTFSDAMITTKTLGFRFLWIDSLCIIQDSREDWVRESLLMAEVYANSACNICALDSADDAAGFLHPRDARSLEPFVVAGELHKKRIPFLVTGSVTVPGGGSQFGDDNGILCTRAWVLQEQLLAPRCLIFSNKQTSWTCRELNASETYPLGRTLSPHLSDFPQNSIIRCVLSGVVDDRLLLSHPGSRMAISSSSQEYFRSWDDSDAKIWMDIVRQYTLRNLTLPSDKLAALSGIAQSLSQRLGRYYAGLWSRLLPWSLLWDVDRSGMKDKQFHRPAVWRAPSWSWASVDGPIGFVFERLVYSYDQAMLVSVQNVTVNTPHGEFGDITDAKLVLKGYLRTANWEWGTSVPPDKPASITPGGCDDCDSDGDGYRLLFDGKICGHLELDDDDDTLDKLSNVVILPVCAGTRDLDLKFSLGEQFLEDQALMHPGFRAEEFQFQERSNQGQGESDDHPDKRYCHVLAGLVLVEVSEDEGEERLYKRLGLFEIVGDEHILDTVIGKRESTEVSLV